MANFENVSNYLEGIIASRLSADRDNQGDWEWYNALKKIVSANRVTGTVRVYGPAAVVDSDFVVVDGVSTLWGVVLDNSNAAEAVFVTILDGNATDTPGTEHSPGVIVFVPSATRMQLVYPNGVSYGTTGIAVFAGTGTDAGLEAGTGVTGTNPTIVLVYTE